MSFVTGQQDSDCWGISEERENLVKEEHEGNEDICFQMSMFHVSGKAEGGKKGVREGGRE